MIGSAQTAKRTERCIRVQEVKHDMSGSQRKKNDSARILRQAVLLLTAVAILALSLGVYALCVIGHAPETPPRLVGQPVDLIGEVTSVFRQAYAAKIILKLREENSMFHVGESVEVTFSGIGEVSTWRAYGLKPGDIIRVTVRFVENSYWEAFDSDWNYE
jgi:hypothetical protein